MNEILAPAATELSPWLVGLLRWTGLLACAWLVHGGLRHRHPRSRILLWRTVLTLTLALPLWQAWRTPALSLQLSAPMAEGLGISVEEPGPISESTKTPPPIGAPAMEPSALKLEPPPNSPGRSPAGGAGPVTQALIWLWALGAGCGALRLWRWQLQLGRLRREGLAVDSEIGATVSAVAAELEVRQRVETRISDRIRSPFIGGFWRPWMLLPKAWLQDLPKPEVTALLRHELAHVRGQDLRWSIAWRWVATLAWFQPLIWRAPAAHSLACEQEADRLAAGSGDARSDYAGLLARLALRVLARPLPGAETKLALNASSDLVQRLQQLEQGEPRPWHRRHSVLAGLGVALLLVGAISWRVSVAHWPGRRSPTANRFGTVLVTVLTKAGRPIAGAVIQPDGLREHRNPASHYNWTASIHGTPIPATTDARGQATISYPKMTIPEEDLRTVQISFSVTHPDFTRVRPTEYPVDGSAPPVRLSPGVRIEVSGFYGPRREPVLELVPNLSAESKVKWQDQTDGLFTSDLVAPGGKLLQLMGRLPGGEIVFSDTAFFTAAPGQPSRQQLELKRGIRLTGSVDASVPRPVKNGRVLIAVRPREFPAMAPDAFYARQEKYGHFRPWKTYRTIDADGNFVFESIPPGELDVIVHGDGFCSRPGQLVPAGAVGPRGFGLPQTFALESPVTDITVLTEATATVRVTVKNRRGEPLSGAKVYFNPNVLRMEGIFGEMRRSSEEPFLPQPPLPKLPWTVTTDRDGVAVAENLPALTRFLSLEHSDFELPIAPGHDDREVRFEQPLAPGETRVINVVAQAKGRQLLGNK